MKKISLTLFVPLKVDIQVGAFLTMGDLTYCTDFQEFELPAFFIRRVLAWRTANEETFQ
jgi:hypothetical protein